jgi:ferredoxin
MFPVKRRLTLHFPREAVHQPITYRLAVDFDVAAKILRAQVAPNQLGTMVVELSGDIDELDAAELWLERQGLGINRAPGEIRIDPQRCVDCGICSSVCPSGALRFDPAAQRLHFEAALCLVCEQCIPSCPLTAIALVLEPRSDGPVLPDSRAAMPPGSPARRPPSRPGARSGPSSWS